MMPSLLKRMFGGPPLKPNEKWVNKPQPVTKKDVPIFKDHIHKRNREYWFGNKRVKYLIREARKQGLIVAPPDHKD